MAIYHLSIKNISRGDGRSAVAAAAYRSGERLWNAREDRWADFSVRQTIVHTEIVAPQGAPGWALDRATLWNTVEAAEKRKDARLCKEVEFALPLELSREQRIDLARAFAGHFVAKGLIADIAIHDDDGGNPHGHMLLTTRTIEGDVFGKKLRALDSKKFVTESRAVWSELANAALRQAGVATTIDHRTLQAQGIDRPPQVHQGPVVHKMVARGRQPSSKVVRYRSPWGNVRDVDYRRIDTGSRIERSEEVQGMTRDYDDLINTQRQIAGLRKEEPDRFEQRSAQDHRLIDLYARREHLLGRVEREEVERGFGLGETDQRELLDQWDRENRPVPDRDDRPVHPRDPRAVHDDRDAVPDRSSAVREVDRAGRPGASKELAERRVDGRPADLTPSAWERRQVDRDIERIRSDRFLSDDQKDERLRPLVTRSLDLARAERGHHMRPAQRPVFGDEDRATPEEVKERMARDFDEQDRQYEQSRGVDEDKWWERDLVNDRATGDMPRRVEPEQTRSAGRPEETDRQHQRADPKDDEGRWWEHDDPGHSVERAENRDLDDDRDERDRDARARQRDRFD